MESRILTRQAMLEALEQRQGVWLTQRFQQATVAVCGLGGLGSHVAQALARSGIGRLILVDYDTVDLSNLHRQGYAVAQIGKYKTDAIRETLQAIAPYCEVVTHCVALCRENIPALLGDADVICECFDRADQKAMLLDCVAADLPASDLICASGMAGLGDGNAIVTRRLTQHIWLCGDGTSDVVQQGTLYAPRVMLCASQQALITLQVLAGKTDEPERKHEHE